MTQHTTAGAADNIRAFHAAVQAGATSDLYDLGEITREAAHYRAALETLASEPLKSGWRNVAANVANDRSLYVRKLARSVREQVQRTHTLSLAERDAIRAACEPPELNRGALALLAGRVRAYENNVVAMSDDGITRHAEEYERNLTPRAYDEARVLVAELQRRNLAEPAQALQDAVHARRVGYLTDARYTAACDLLARAEAWLAQAGDDPELIVVVKGTAHHVRTSELLNAEGV
jgi:hypothetical protein